MGFIPSLIMGGAGLLGSLFGNKKPPKPPQGSGNPFQINPGTPLYDYLRTGMMPGSTSTTSSGQSSSTNAHSLQSRNILSAPEVSGAYKPMEGILQRIMMQRLNSPSALPAGYEQGGIIDTNRTFAPIEKAAQNRLASTGVYDSGAQAGLQAYLGGQRGSSIADFRRQIPIQERALRNEDMGLAQALISQFGLGRRESGTITEDSQSNTSSGGGSSTTNSPHFDPSGPLQYMDLLNRQQSQPQGRNAFGSLMDMMGFLGGSGMFGSQSSGAKGGPSGWDMFRTTPFFG